jgi:hypothetical protein
MRRIETRGAPTLTQGRQPQQYGQQVIDLLCEASLGKPKCSLPMYPKWLRVLFLTYNVLSWLRRNYGRSHSWSSGSAGSQFRISFAVSASRFVTARVHSRNPAVSVNAWAYPRVGLYTTQNSLSRIGRLRDRSSILGNGEGCFSDPQRPDRLQPSMQWVPGVLPWEESGRGAKLTTHVNLVPRLRVRGGVLPLPPCVFMVSHRVSITLTV